MLTFLKNNFLHITFPLGLLLLLNACYKKPEFPKIPEISFVDIRSVTRVPGQNLDSLVITIRYRDGDGNLGIDAEDRKVPNKPGGSIPDKCGQESPFQEFFYTCNAQNVAVDSTFNQFYYNYFTTVLRKNGNAFEEVSFPSPQLGFNGAFEEQFERIPPDNTPKDGPLEAQLFRNLTVFRSTVFRPNDVIKFRIKIVDRAKNFSNEIETDTIRILRQ
jgi:hypothetical protein